MESWNDELGVYSILHQQLKTIIMFAHSFMFTRSCTPLRNVLMWHYIHSFIHSFIPDIDIAPHHETYSEALSVQLRPKRNVLRSWQKEDTLFRGRRRNVRGSINAQLQLWLYWL